MIKRPGGHRVNPCEGRAGPGRCRARSDQHDDDNDDDKDDFHHYDGENDDDCDDSDDDCENL